jgi:CheY-like chemotaxis protein
MSEQGAAALTVLLVEDNHDNRAICSTILEHAGRIGSPTAPRQIAVGIQDGAAYGPVASVSAVMLGAVGSQRKKLDPIPSSLFTVRSPPISRARR